MEGRTKLGKEDSRRNDPNGPLPLPAGEEILVVPMEAPPANDLVQIVMDLQREGVRATLGEAVALPSSAFDPIRGQFRVERVLARARECDARRVLAMTARDLYAEGSAFVFGAADVPGRAAVISLFRLHQGEDGELFRVRVLKEAIRQIGRMLDLPPCSHPRCVMRPVANLAEIDATGTRLCGNCLLLAGRKARGRA